MTSDLQNQDNLEQGAVEPNADDAAILSQAEETPSSIQEPTNAEEVVPATEAVTAPAVAETAPVTESAEPAALPSEQPAETPSPAAETPEAAAQDEQAAKTEEAHKQPKMSDEEAQPIWNELTKALEDNTILKVLCERSISGGAIVSFKGIEGFVPKSQFSAEKNVPQTEIDVHKGQEMEIMVIELSGFEKRRFVGSRKKAMKEQRYSELKVGDVVEGTITSLTDYGAFVNLGGGIDGLIHISRMSKAHVDKPNDMLAVNDMVKVRIVDINKEKDRVSLSMKEFTESPWSAIEGRYQLGAVVKGTIRSLTDFGAYVKLDQDFSGLIHISDLSWTKRVEHPSEIVTVGQEVDVKILDINRKKRRISLSLRDALPDPWPQIANLYAVGSTVNGRIKRLFEPGMIVELDHDVDCFVPRGRMGQRKPKQEEPTYKLGDTIELKVIEIDPDKRTLVCGVPREEQPHQDRRREDTQPKYKVPATTDEHAGFTLGEISGLSKLLLKTEPEAPVADAAPATDATPVADAAPVTDATPVADAAPVTDATPTETPAPEQADIVNPDTPAAEPTEMQPEA